MITKDFILLLDYLNVTVSHSCLVHDVTHFKYPPLIAIRGLCLDSLIMKYTCAFTHRKTQTTKKQSELFWCHTNHFFSIQLCIYGVKISDLSNNHVHVFPFQQQNEGQGWTPTGLHGICTEYH